MRTLAQKHENCEEGLFSLIYESYYHKVYMIALSIIRDGYLAEDVLQETFIKAYQKLDQIKEREKIGSWLSTIATRTAIDFVRKEKKTRARLLDESIVGSGDSSIIVENVLEKQFFEKEMKRKIERLKPEYRQVLELRYYRGLKETEIEHELNVSKSCVKTRLYRARKTLKSQLEPVM